MVLDDAKFDQPTVTINGKSVANLKEFNTGIFSAGFAKPGTAAIPFFFVNNPQGTQLKTTGEEGYAMVLKNLPVGKDTIDIMASSTSTYFGPSNVHNTDIINII